MNQALWFQHLDDDEQEFIKKFLLVSGSLKALANSYGVSYPTVRLRLSRLIDKVKLYDKRPKQPFIADVMQMVIDHKISLDVANEIIRSYQEEMKGFRIRVD
ncbi:MAG: DUF2089 domain-containing protein [Sporolactobacillus sp.]|jgi:hypothetical protein|nr:DUF2089 domain-containing protein [Sporolactobacillus sp.]